MSSLTESAIENFAIKLFERLCYSYLYTPDDGEYPERGHHGKALLAATGS